MATDWRNNPLIRLAVIVVILALLISFFLPERRDDSDQKFADKVSESVGMMAAEQGAKLLGDSGGSAVLIFLGSETTFEVTGAGLYEKSFRAEAAKHAGFQVAGRILVPTPIVEDGRGYNALTYRALQAVREKFPSATLFVSFANLPIMEEPQMDAWVKSMPPKTLVVQQPQPDPVVLQSYFQKGIVHALIQMKANVRYPETKPTNPREVFNSLYDVVLPK